MGGGAETKPSQLCHRMVPALCLSGLGNSTATYHDADPPLAAIFILCSLSFSF